MTDYGIGSGGLDDLEDLSAHWLGAPDDPSDEDEVEAREPV
ncbi:hypothetical protein [Luteipulveratus mongoliensis]|nr:hypothetical protein [Luteipulveratus mongoliensis]